MTVEVLLTCGGTSEPVDDVRVLTNISTGRFGHALAAELATYKPYTVTEICPKATLERLGVRDGVAYEHYRTTEDLRVALYERETVPGIVLQAAAVSDYRPVAFKGKMSSDQDSLTIHLEKTPKLIAGLREHYGPKTFLVGFKLLSGVTRDELIAAAFKQLKANRLNMVIANDLQTLKDGQHPVLVITAEGGAIPFTGSRDDVVKELAEFIHRREQVSWFSSLQDKDVTATPVGTERFATVLSAVKSMNLLTDASGNISVRGDDDQLHLNVSPRGVDKSLLTEDDAIPALVDTSEQIIYFNAPESKPSIDTGVESLLYEAFPQFDAIIHFHRGWGAMAVETTFPYPCGVREEAEDILSAVALAGGAPEHQPLAVELIHHGFVVGFDDHQLQELLTQWSAVLAEFDEHIDEVTPPEDLPLIPLDASRYRPIWHGARIVGLIHDNPEATVVYLAEAARGTGLGHRIIEQLIERGSRIQTVDDCNVRDFYKHFGFTETSNGGAYWLQAPVKPLAKRF